jgi:thioredoxin reductase
MTTDYDVAVVGAGPAGLSAAITLGRACRRVLVLDHGQPRNVAANAVNCYLGRDGVAPTYLRELGRREASRYGAMFLDAEVTNARCTIEERDRSTRFTIDAAGRTFEVRAMLLATGVVDVLPRIPGVDEFYGKSVHHCPYCDGWEHKNRHLIALGNGPAVVELALTLAGWSKQVTACTNGETLSLESQQCLERNRLGYRHERIARFCGVEQALQQIEFADGTGLACDALFFGSSQGQRSQLPRLLGCDYDKEGLVITRQKQCTSVEGVFIAGDADGDVQFAIVAAAEGATAATAIHKYLLNQEQR